MKLEITLASTLPPTNQLADSKTSRKELRVRTDALIADGQIELVQAVERCCETMLSVGAILFQRQHVPVEADLIEAITASIENARAVMDNGLLLDSESTTKCGAVMLELAVRGFLAAVGVPYDNVMVEVHRARVAGEPPKVRELLEAAGLVQPKAANDESANP
jgi:hypothetical protein